MLYVGYVGKPLKGRKPGLTNFVLFYSLPSKIDKLPGTKV